MGTTQESPAPDPSWMRNGYVPLATLGIRETWKARKCSTESVVSYVMDMHDKLLVKNNLEDSQRQQKYWYDRNTKNHFFHEGESVLILLTSTTNKLLASWLGPYPITQRVSKTSLMKFTCLTRKGNSACQHAEKMVWTRGNYISEDANK